MPLDPEVVKRVREQHQRGRVAVNARGSSIQTQTGEPSWWEQALARVGETPVVGDVLKGVGKVFDVVDYPWEKVYLPQETQVFNKSETPLWERMLKTLAFNANPGGYIGSDIVAGTGNLSRARKEYEETKYPKYFKGLLETANPTYLVPFSEPFKGASIGAKVLGAESTAEALTKLGAGVSAIETAPSRALGKLAPEFMKKFELPAKLSISKETPESVAKLQDIMKQTKGRIKEISEELSTKRAQRETIAQSRIATLPKTATASEKLRIWEQSMAGAYDIERGISGATGKWGWTGLNESEGNEIMNWLHGYDYKPLRNRKINKNLHYDQYNATKAMEELVLEGKVPVESRMRLLEEALGPEFTSSIQELEKAGKLSQFLDIANLPRAVISAYDLSGMLRQGGILTTRLTTAGKVGTVGRVFKDMVKSFISEKHAMIMDDIIRERPYFMEYIEHGGYHAPLNGTLSKSEEAFMSKLSRHIPGIRRSERAYITVLNDLRSESYHHTRQVFDNVVAKSGIPITDQDLKGLANLVNVASGRGSIGAMTSGNMGPALNAVFFSPRLVASRLQWPAILLNPNTPKLVRKEAMKQMAAFLGAGTTLLTMAKLAGASINANPLSSDFGKIKIGDTRLDIWTGYAQYSRFLAQLTTAQRLTSIKEIQNLNRDEVIYRFAQSKLAPATGLFWDIFKGESYMGEDIGDIDAQAYNRLVPLFVQDLIDAINDQGAIGGLIASPAALGVGVITYPDEALAARQQLSQKFNIPDELWNTSEYKEALKIVKPYNEITEKAWEQYPELEAIAEQINVLKKTNKTLALQIQRQYPMILRIREQIARQKQQMLLSNPDIKAALKLVNQ